MFSGDVKLTNPERFMSAPEITNEMLDKAIEKAIKKLKYDLQKRGPIFTPPETINYVYEERPNNEWTSGLNTGVYWLAWELSGDKVFFDAAKEQMATYKQRYDTKAGLMGHDVGFVMTPSCVADYKLTGDEQSKEIALMSAYLLADNYCEAQGFIRRSRTIMFEPYWRSLVDTMMNLPLLLWAWKETGDEKFFRDKVIAHYNTTAKYLVRSDGSTYHHFKFDAYTYEPVGGLTLQGYSDESCWSRGHSWLIYGYPIAYSYTKDEKIWSVHRAVTNYFLNKLPSDGVAYWDLVFEEGSDEPRDASASAVSVCGLLEAIKFMPDGDEKTIYKNAAAQMMAGLMEKCSNDDFERDGILTHVTHALPQKRGIDESAIYGDYFYLEALLRYKKPDWKKYW